MAKKNFNYLEKDMAIPCPAGDRKKDKHMLVKDGNNLSLKKVGEIDIQEQINSYEDGVSLAKMIERYKRGDTSALNRDGGFYGDVSGFATDVVDVLNNNRAVMDAAQKQAASAADSEPAADAVPAADAAPAPAVAPVPAAAPAPTPPAASAPANN